MRTQIIPASDAYISEKEAARFLSVSPRTLQAWRHQCKGPAFTRAGRAIRYRKCDLVKWLDAGTVRPTEFESNND